MVVECAAMDGWALDLGTTNSGVARWDSTAGQAVLVELPDVCRLPEGDDPLEAPRMVPTAVYFPERRGLFDRLGDWGPLVRRTFVGRSAFIGRQALERNQASLHPSFVPGFKASLSAEAGRPVARVGGRAVSARMAARAFFRELLAETDRHLGHRIRDLVVAAPVSAFETYRAEVRVCLESLGVRRVRFVDEPLAVALGYGLGLASDTLVLVVDIGGGTMHTEVVHLTPRGAQGGQAEVVAKRGRPLGGNAVDGWVLCDVAARAGYPVDEWADDEETRFWRRLMLAEACRVKEAVFFDERTTFLLAPPGALAQGGVRQPGSSFTEFTRTQLVEILERQGFYREIENCFDEMFASGRVKADDIEHVLVVGGSTLLPGVFPRLERIFERRRVRAWQPFEAVAYGAAGFAADRFGTVDFIVHDYAFVTHDPATGAPQYTVVVPRGTRFPTPPSFWTRQVVPTCAMGEPETVFRLAICEVARADGGERRFVWDAAGDVQKVGGATGRSEVVVPLNAGSPTLGYLDPPHQPQDRRPRLQISFAVNADRWLVASVQDLLTRRELMREEPVVRLL
jgi:molecular chaperone DnaK (HSP70)